MIKLIGECTINLFESLKFIFSKNFRFKECINQIANIGADSLAIAGTIVFITGAVISLQLSKQFAMSGTEGYIGGVVAFAIIRELGPGFAALAISARSGTAMAAEVANMKITQQIDAMKTLGVSPIGYLFAPRLVAATIAIPLVSIIAQLIGIIGGIIVAYATVELHPNMFLYSIWTFMDAKDLFIGIIKAAAFGLLISLVCCTQGYLTKGGAKEVGIATTKAAMYSTIVLFICDLILSWIFFT